MSETVVVVGDVTGRFVEGEILSGNAARVARLTEGVAVLPVDAGLVERSGVTGWAKRAYGRGFRYEASRSVRGSLLSLYLVQDRPRMFWTARLELDPERRYELAEKAPIAGQLHFAQDTGQFGTSLIGISCPSGALNIAPRIVDDQGGWYIEGEAIATVQTPGLVGLMLYGHLDGVVVKWFAASQVPR